MGDMVEGVVVGNLPVIVWSTKAWVCSKGPQKAPPVNLSLTTSGEKVKAEVHYMDSAINANDNLC